MQTATAKATAYLDKLEADRQAAIAMSEQKAEEAKLIEARQEGFRAAMEILVDASSVSSRELQPDEAVRRRPRRDIAQLILRELFFSGKAMTVNQIAKAIDYIPERTEVALKRLEIAGELTRDENGRWAAAITNMAKPNGHTADAKEDFSLAIVPIRSR